MPTTLTTVEADPFNGTAGDDFMLGFDFFNTASETIRGLEGDDFILADSSNAFFTGTSASFNAPHPIDNTAVWTVDENPFFANAAIPHTSLYVRASENERLFSSVTVGIGETITIDVDFGDGHPAGINTDVIVQLYSSVSSLLTSDDNGGLSPADAGSVSGNDSRLTWTNSTGSAQTYTICFLEAYDGNYEFEGGETFIANISVSGHATGAASVMGNDALYGGVGDDTLAGQGGNDSLLGEAGDDALFGGSGDDTLNGGTGVDTAWYADAGAAVVVNLAAAGPQATGGAGADTLVSIERLVGSAYDDNLFGSIVANYLFGGLGNDFLQGGDGNDQLIGDWGNDTIFGDGGNDHIDAGPGANLVFGGAGDDHIYGLVGSDRFYGGDGDDTFYDSGGNDTFDGGTGIDQVYFSLAGAVTIDLALTGPQNTGGVGTDTFVSIENVQGSEINDVISGNASANLLDGSGGNDVLEGRGGNDRLWGGLGADTMTGGDGNDTYYVDDSGDRMIEAVGGGTDAVKSGISVVIGSNVENLLITGSAAANGTGNAVANLIIGNAANNIINGSGGNDTLRGMAGNDTVAGGTGNDTLTGGANSDKFLFNAALNGSTNVDQITDFSSIADTIVLDQTIFSGIASLGILAAADFRIGTSAGDASDRIIYNSANGNIYYDPDGTGAAAQILFAHVAAGTVMTNADFLVVA